MRLQLNMALAILCIVILSACSTNRKLTYFNDIAAATGTDAANRLPQIHIQPGDVLQITIATYDKEVSLLLNPNQVSTPGISGNGMEQGYLVDSAGNISLPMVGKLNVQGKTTAAINDQVAQELQKTIKNVYVSTRLVNFQVSVLGDVARPGSFRIGAERASVLDALSMAGDLNVTAKRDDIMIIREVNGVKNYTSINLNDSKMLSSPYYYLVNNDVIYVKPGPGKLFPTSKLLQLLPAILSTISLITTIVILSK